jgi:hypothetical protein
MLAYAMPAQTMLPHAMADTSHGRLAPGMADFSPCRPAGAHPCGLLIAVRKNQLSSDKINFYQY